MGDEDKSRTQKKKEDRALQKIGEQLVSLPSKQLEHIDMEEELLEAIDLARKTKSHEARRRQMQYIGALMRDMDLAPIRQAIENILLGDYHYAHALKKIEKWRDDIIEGNTQIIEEILDSFPEQERQRLTQLARNARKFSGTRKAAKSSSSLFRYLKEISGL